MWKLVSFVGQKGISQIGKFGDSNSDESNNEWREERAMIGIFYGSKEHRPEIYYRV